MIILKTERETESTQLPLPFQRDAEHLKRYLEEKTGRPLTLILTDNSSLFLSVRRKKQDVIARVQKIFLEADNEILSEIAGFISGRYRQIPLARAFVKQNISRLQPRSKTKTPSCPKGKFHDLKIVFAALNDRYFDGKLCCTISWGRQKVRRYASMRTLGSYNYSTNSSRIHSLLDRRQVPGYFVAYIVYHEMLHCALGVKELNGKRIFHPEEFRKHERLYHDYEKATAWERVHFRRYA